MSGNRSVRNRLTSVDALLAVLAVVGVALYVFLLPSQHPDSAADYSLTEDGAVDAARSFLLQSGRAPDTLYAKAVFRRHEDLLDSLQQDLGRSAAIDVLEGEIQDLLPAYYWRVSWQTEKQKEDWGSQYVYRVLLSEEGDPWSFSNRNKDEHIRPNREALAQVFNPGDIETTQTSLREVTDSTLQADLFFALSDTASYESPQLALLNNGQARSVALDSLAVVKMAGYYLGRVPLGKSDLSFRVDSVKTDATDPDLVEVFFSSEDDIYEQVVTASISVRPTGGLQHVQVSYNPQSTGDSSGNWRTILVDIVQGVMFFLLFVTFIIVFFRRLIGKSIDVKAALLDGLVIGLVLAVYIVVSGNVVNPGEDADMGELILSYLIALPLIAGFTALMVFLVAGATDSIARPIWPEKLETLALFRQVSFVNQRVGRAVLRGMLLAYAMLGVMTVMLIVLPSVRVNLGDYDGLLDDSMSQIVQNFTLAGFVNYLVLVLALLGVGSALYGRVKKAWVVVPVMALVITLFQAFPLALLPNMFTWAHTAVFSLCIALCFWYFDFVTALVMGVFTWVLWMASAGWLVESSPVYIDFALTHVMAGGVLVLGTTGVLSKRTGDESGHYVPTYVTEMAQQARLKKEVEIARQVQEAFLPRRMPEVQGLDIAAMCLAALEVGGDYYDFVKLSPTRLAVVVGDVSGKGTQAAFYMTLTKGVIQTLSREGLSPADVMRRFNTLFYENVPRGTFISMIYGVIDVEHRSFTFARAGHNPVILKRSPSQDPDLVQPDGLAIGLVSGAPFNNSIEEVTLDLRIGDVLVFYTDGFSEAMNRARDQYGDDRLARKVGDVGQKSANGILMAVTEDVHHFVEAAGRHDDMTMVVVKLDRSAAKIQVPVAQTQVMGEA